MTLEATARIVALHHTVGTAARRRMTPRARQPSLIESDFAARLVSMVKQWRAEIQPLFDQLGDIVTTARRYRTDDDSERVRRIVLRGKQTVGRTASATRDSAQRAGRLVVDHGKREFSRQSKAALGVELQTLDHAVPTRVAHFIAQNVAEMERLGNKTMGDVESLVARAFTSDKPIEQLAAALEERFGIAERQARWLAADQILKLNSQVARMRYREVGIATFRWQTMNDHFVRKSHQLKHGKVFPYEGSSAPSFFPGDEFACRCQEIPIFDEIRMKAGITGVGKSKVGLGGVNRRRARKDSEAAMRIVIAGGPRCGKTTFAATLGEAKHTDDLISMGWSEASAETSSWFDATGPWVVEGVAAPRALRKWLAAHREGKPCDVVHWMGRPYEQLSPGQLGMLRGCETVWAEIVGELRRRGVEIRVA